MSTIKCHRCEKEIPKGLWNYIDHARECPAGPEWTEQTFDKEVYAELVECVTTEPITP